MSAASHVAAGDEDRVLAQILNRTGMALVTLSWVR